MIKIYFSNYKNRLDDLDFLKYANLLPLKIQEKILRLRNWEDRHATLYGKLLLKKGLKDLGLDSSLTNLKYTPYNRPYLEGKLDFNISHSNCFVVCAISTNSKIGIDIEKIKPMLILDFKEQFSKEEWDTIVNSDNAYFWFYYYWTAKEAVIKANGKGLSLPLKNITIKNSKTKIEDITWYIKNIPFNDGYVLHIAADEIIKTETDLVEISF